MDDLYSLLECTHYIDHFQKYCLHLFSTIYQKIGWDPKESEDPLTPMLRPMVIASMGTSGDQAVIDEAGKRFKRHINGDLINPDIRSSVYSIVSLYGDENTLKELQKLFKEADTSEEKSRLLSAMGYSTDSKIIEETLNFVFQGV